MTASNRSTVALVFLTVVLVVLTIALVVVTGVTGDRPRFPQSVSRITWSVPYYRPAEPPITAEPSQTATRAARIPIDFKDCHTIRIAYDYMQRRGISQKKTPGRRHGR